MPAKTGLSAVPSPRARSDGRRVGADPAYRLDVVGVVHQAQHVVGRWLGRDHRDVVGRSSSAELAGQPHGEVDPDRVERVAGPEVVADERVVPRARPPSALMRAQRYPAAHGVTSGLTPFTRVRRATTGSSRPARRAGATPKKTPTATETPKASAGDHQAITAGSGETASDQQRRPDAEPDADEAADDAQQHGLDEELQQDVALPGAERLAQADLAGPLAHADQHDVGDADPADQQRDGGDRGEHQGEQAEDPADGAEDLGLGDRGELLAGVLRPAAPPPAAACRPRCRRWSAP